MAGAPTAGTAPTDEPTNPKFLLALVPIICVAAAETTRNRARSMIALIIVLDLRRDLRRDFGCSGCMASTASAGKAQPHDGQSPSAVSFSVPQLHMILLTGTTSKNNEMQSAQV
jgi:hypothetical protein